MPRTPIALAVLLALAGCELEAIAEADSVCLTEPARITLPPADVEGTVTLPFAFTIDIGPIVPDDLNENGVSAELIASSFTLGSLEGVSLAGIEAAELVVQKPSDPGSTVTFRFTRTADAASTAIVLTPTTPVDLIDYLDDTELLQIDRVTLSGRAPDAAWTPVLTTCAEAEITVDEVEAVGL
jgi:hypothetical protein